MVTTGDVSGRAAHSAGTKRSSHETRSQAVHASTTRVTRSTRLQTPPPPSSGNSREEPPTEIARNPRRAPTTAENHVNNLDVEAVDSALRREIQQRQNSPGPTSHRKRQRINGDRYVLLRVGFSSAFRSLTSSQVYSHPVWTRLTSQL